ncbi:MAG: universal stress protein, partial [Desulfobacteraceae bacterium]|nr:universal stress protein [Desulfobacteraceae bacterium]
IGTRSINKILLPTAGGPHALLASEYVAILKKAYNTDVTFCNVAGSNPTERQKDLAIRWIDETIAKNALQGSARKLVIESDHIAKSLIKAGADYDLLVLGASREGLFSSVLLGEITEEAARNSEKPVMVVKRYEGVAKSIVKKVLG